MMKNAKNIADIKVIKGLYDSPHNERHWGRWLARNMINSKQKPGLGVKMSKMGKAIKRLYKLSTTICRLITSTD